jgi:hypothetical protein
MGRILAYWVEFNQRGGCARKAGWAALLACWAAWATRGGGGKQASRTDGCVSAHSAEIKRKFFLFSKSFYNLQTNLNAIQIRISTTSTCKNKI